MKKLYAGMAVLALAALCFWQKQGEAESPVVYLDGAVTTPARAGEFVAVMREYTILKAVPLQVSRFLIQGDCKKEKCLIYEMQDSALMPDLGTHKQVRMLQLPSDIKPGVYRMAFYVSWRHGVTSYKTEAPELIIEIIE